LLTITSSDDSTITASRARVSSKRRRSVISRAIVEMPTISPVVLRIGETVNDTSSARPYRARRTVSK